MCNNVHVINSTCNYYKSKKSKKWKGYFLQYSYNALNINVDSMIIKRILAGMGGPSISDRVKAYLQIEKLIHSKISHWAGPNQLGTLELNPFFVGSRKISGPFSGGNLGNRKNAFLLHVRRDSAIDCRTTGTRTMV